MVTQLFHINCWIQNRSTWSAMMAHPVLRSTPLEHVEKALDSFINRSLDEFSSGNLTFKQSLVQIRNIFSQPSLRLQLARLAEDVESCSERVLVNPSSKEVVHRLSEWLSVKTDDAERSSNEVLRQFQGSRICLATQLTRLWIFVHRHLHQFRSKGLLSLAPALSPHHGSAGSLRSELQSELGHHLPPQLVGHLGVLARTIVQSLRLLTSALREELTNPSSASFIEFLTPTCLLSSVILAELLCHSIFWVMSLPQQEATNFDALLNLRRAYPSFLTSISDVVEVAVTCNELKKVETLLQHLCAILTSPLLPSSTLKSFTPRASTLFWNVTIGSDNQACREVCPIIHSLLHCLCPIFPNFFSLFHFP